MPSEIAQQIVDRIFGGEKAQSLDLAKDAFASTTYDLIQQRKLEFAKTMGFDLENTAQEVADELEDSLPTGEESSEDIETTESETEIENEEETENETYQ